MAERRKEESEDPAQAEFQVAVWETEAELGRLLSRSELDLCKVFFFAGADFGTRNTSRHWQQTADVNGGQVLDESEGVS